MNTSSSDHHTTTAQQSNPSIRPDIEEESGLPQTNRQEQLQAALNDIDTQIQTLRQAVDNAVHAYESALQQYEIVRKEIQALKI